MGLAVVLYSGGCVSTRYITDQPSAKRQHEMHRHRTGVNIGDVLLSTASLILSGTTNSEFNFSQSERAFKKISIINASSDSLMVNMVTDIEWKKGDTCDVFGIVLPPRAGQKLLVPYPAAYNVYFKTPASEEEMVEIRTDDKQSNYKLKPGTTQQAPENK